MKIRDIEVVPVSIPFNIAFRVPGGEVPAADHSIVKVHTDDGVYGIGEAATIAAYSEETVYSTYAILTRVLAPLLIGHDPRNIGSIHEVMDQAVHANYFAKAAIDLACYDILGKSLGVPVHTLLGGAFRDRILVGQSIGIKDAETAAADAVRYVQQGFHSIKIKIGIDPKADLERVAAIRDAVGPDVDLRVDANQGYSVDTAVKTLRAMESYDLLLVEQPVPRWDIDGMAHVAHVLDTPVLADESVFTPSDAIAIVRKQAADILNIKIMKPGGLYGSLKIAGIASGANLPLAIGSMVEMGIGTAAGAHFAAACRDVRYPCDVKGPSLLKDDILQEPVRIEGGYTYVPEGSGLGVDWDDDKVAHYRMDL